MNLTTAKLQAQIAAIRASAAVFLTDTAYLKRRTAVTYVDGEARSTYGTPVSFSCRLIVRSGSESANIARQLREVQQNTFTGLYRMQIPYTLQVSEGDHISYTDQVSGLAKELEVLFVPAKNEYTGAVVIQLQQIK